MNKRRNNGTIFIILGAAVAALGGILYYVGGNYGIKFVYLGAGICAVGLAILIYGIFVYRAIIKSLSNNEDRRDYTLVDDMLDQVSGRKTIFDVFKSEDGKRIFSFYRSYTCYLKEDGVAVKGSMEPLEWEDDHPTLWQIVLEDGREFTVYKVDTDIIAEGEGKAERYHRN